jgi:hypothetical protein
MTYMRKLILQIGLAALVWLMALAPTPVSAAAAEMTPTVKAAFDKMVDGAEPSLGSRLSLVYKDLLTLGEQNKTWDQTIKTIHTENTQRLAQIREQLKHLDADKRSSLEQECKQTKAQYEPLFAAYTTLNRQIAVARLFKSKEVNAALRAQAEAMKLPLQVAHQEVKAKSDAVKAVKSSTAKTIKRVRATITETGSLQAELKAKRKAITSLNRSFTTAWKQVSPAVRKGNATATLGALTDAVSSSRQRNEQKQASYALETGIRDILQKAESQLK